MPMSVVYTTVNGQILCENRGGVVSHLVSDPLGSVVMVRDNAGNTVYEAEYDPYGNVQSETGTNPSEFGYVGTLGYVKDSAFSLYVRARYLLTNLGRWLTKDPLWPRELGYVYAGARPNVWGDPSGAIPPQLAAALLGCAGSGLFGVIGGLIGGHSLGSSLCRGLIGCVAGALASFIASSWPWLARCIMSAVAGLIASLAATICSPPPDPCQPFAWQCLAVGTIISMAFGCLGNMFENDLVKWILPAFGLSASSVCNDIVRGRPGKFLPGIGSAW